MIFLSQKFLKWLIIEKPQVRNFKLKAKVYNVGKSTCGPSIVWPNMLLLTSWYIKTPKYAILNSRDKVGIFGNWTIDPQFITIKNQNQNYILELELPYINGFHTGCLGAT